MNDQKIDGVDAPATVIASDAKLVGEMSFERGARVLGVVEGRIDGRGELHLEAGATARAEIMAESIQVDGRVIGNVAASQRLELSSDAVVEGDIVARSLIVAEGASFSGHCRVGESIAETAAEAKPTNGQHIALPSEQNTAIDGGAGEPVGELGGRLNALNKS
ncbi:MAG: polymer-forming cytoskeletal protein [Planctomycetota bacterium]